MKKFIEEFNGIWFVSIMGISAFALSTNIYFGNISFFKIFARFLLIVSIIFFFFFLTVLLIKIFRYPQKVVNEFHFALPSNLYAAIPIASSLIVISLITIGLPFIDKSFLVNFEYILWLFSFILSVILVIIIPINLKFKTKIDDVLGVWFIPPVGLFVLNSAGSLLASQTSFFSDKIVFINLLLLGPAFILYFLTLILVYFRSKFTEMPESQFAPTFFIVLAPVGVSIIDVAALNKVISLNNTFNLTKSFEIFTKLYLPIMWGYGLWVIAGLMLLMLRFIRRYKKINFSPTWWAFVFPFAAYTNSTNNVYNLYNMKFVKISGYIFYFILLLLWTIVVIKQILMFYNKK